MINYDYLIVGAGLCGCVFAERLASRGKSIMLVEQRSHIGGNCFDFHNEDGILVHKYGPHWFHTNDSGVYEYLGMFTKWRHFGHVVKSFVNNRLLPFPVNRQTLNSLYALDLRSASDVEAYLESVRDTRIVHPQNAEEAVVHRMGRQLHETFFRGYSRKQWGIDPSLLDASVTARIPIRFDNDERYFTDRFQGLPTEGYTAMFQRMVSSPAIDLVLGTNYKCIINDVRFRKMIYTGSIDEFFDLKFGALPYRSLRFEHETVEREFYQPCQQVNYPNDYDFTRIIDGSTPLDNHLL